MAHDVKPKLVCNKRARTFSSSSSSFSFLLAFVCFYSVRGDATITHNRLPLACIVEYRKRKTQRHKEREKKKKKKTRKLRHIFHRHTRSLWDKHQSLLFVKSPVNLILSPPSFSVRHICRQSK